ncbi:unnamed protein product [Symbiodinium sp. CCMP2456]|nr:unnamed protein product [Symbiodinium sp. CCMP2456]
MWQTTTPTGLQWQPPDSYSPETSNKLESVQRRLCQTCSSDAVEEWMEFFKEDGDISEEELKVLDGLLVKMDVSGDGRVSSDEIKAALTRKDLEMPEAIRSKLVEFMKDVE